MTAVNPNEKANSHHLSAKEYEELYHRASRFYFVDALEQSVDEEQCREMFNALDAKLNDLNKSARPIGGFALPTASELMEKNMGEVIRDYGDARSEHDSRSWFSFFVWLVL